MYACRKSYLLVQPDLRHWSTLGRSLDLDMHRWWTPSKAEFFQHVTKAKALSIVGELDPTRVAGLRSAKKDVLSDAAAALATEQRWLPPMFH